VLLILLLLKGEKNKSAKPNAFKLTNIKKEEGKINERFTLYLNIKNRGNNNLY